MADFGRYNLNIPFTRVEYPNYRCTTNFSMCLTPDVVIQHAKYTPFVRVETDTIVVVSEDSAMMGANTSLP